MAIRSLAYYTFNDSIRSNNPPETLFLLELRVASIYKYMYVHMLLIIINIIANINLINYCICTIFEANSCGGLKEVKKGNNVHDNNSGSSHRVITIESHSLIE